MFKTINFTLTLQSTGMKLKNRDEKKISTSQDIMYGHPAPIGFTSVRSTSMWLISISDYESTKVNF